MADSLDSEAINAIYERIERKVTLTDCETKEDIITKLIRHPSGYTAQTSTLVKRGFPKRFIELGLTKGWSTEIWKNTPHIIRKVARDSKGRFIAKRHQVIIPYSDFMRNMERYVPTKEIERVKKRILEKRVRLGYFDFRYWS